MTPQFLSSATLLSLPPRICLSQHPSAVLILIARPAAWIHHKIWSTERLVSPVCIFAAERAPNPSAWLNRQHYSASLDFHHYEYADLSGQSGPILFRVR